MAGGAGLSGKMVNHGCLNLGVIAQLVYNSSDALACGGTWGVIDGVFNDSRDPAITRMGGPEEAGDCKCVVWPPRPIGLSKLGADALGRVESVLDAMNLQYESEVGITHDLSYFGSNLGGRRSLWQRHHLFEFAFAIRYLVEHQPAAHRA